MPWRPPCWLREGRSSSDVLLNVDGCRSGNNVEKRLLPEGMGYPVVSVDCGVNLKAYPGKGGLLAQLSESIAECPLQRRPIVGAITIHSAQIQDSGIRNVVKKFARKIVGEGDRIGRIKNTRGEVGEQYAHKPAERHGVG